MIIYRQAIVCKWKGSGKVGEGKNGKEQVCKCIVNEYSKSKSKYVT